MGRDRCQERRPQIPSILAPRTLHDARDKERPTQESSYASHNPCVIPAFRTHPAIPPRPLLSRITASAFILPLFIGQTARRRGPGRDGQERGYICGGGRFQGEGRGKRRRGLGRGRKSRLLRWPCVCVGAWPEGRYKYYWEKAARHAASVESRRRRRRRQGRGVSRGRPRRRGGPRPRPSRPVSCSLRAPPPPAPPRLSTPTHVRVHTHARTHAHTRRHTRTHTHIHEHVHHVLRRHLI
jgi:hypothetical protein